MNYVQVLTRYKAWADDLFLAVVSDVPVLELTAPRPIVFGSLIRTLNHSFAMDYVWQSHLLGKPHGLTTRNPEKHPEMQELATAQRGMDNWYVNYADSISDVNWAKSLSLSSLAAVAEPCLAEIFCFMSSTTPHITVAMPQTFCITSTFFLQPRIFLFFSGSSRLPPNGSFERSRVACSVSQGIATFQCHKADARQRQ